jgi:hypothetical protein
MDEIVVLIYLTRESDAKLCKLSHPQKFTWCITILSFFLGLHSELQKLHMKFVLGNILQESEFWATRKNLLEDEANKGSKQRPGFKSAMLADVRPSADGRTNKVTFSLTTEIIHQVRTFDFDDSLGQAILVLFYCFLNCCRCSSML